MSVIINGPYIRSPILMDVLEVIWPSLGHNWLLKSGYQALCRRLCFPISGSGIRMSNGSPLTKGCQTGEVNSGAMHTRMVFNASWADKSWRIRSTCLKASWTPVRKPLCASCNALIAREICWQPNRVGVFFISMSRSFTAAFFRESGRTFGRVQSTSQQFSSAQYFFRAFPQSSSRGPICKPRFWAVSREGWNISVMREAELSGSYSNTTWMAWPGFERVDWSFSVRLSTRTENSWTPICLSEPSSLRTLTRLPSSATRASSSTVSSLQ